ncbi:MAG TPA: ABC transporter ATP-binding protein [Clostridiales bacterium]|nr:ABC transporter ATP-binding protein [Clostridiales bacterium]
MHSNIKATRDMFRMAGRTRRFSILTLLRCPFDALRTIVQANFLMHAFDAINSGNLNELYHACGLFGVLCLFLFLYNGTVWMLYAEYVTRWVGAIRRKLFEHISGLSLQQVEAKPTGEWIARLNSDVNAATALLNQNMHLPHAIVSFVNICVTSVILVLVNPELFSLIIVFVASHILLNQLFIAKPLMRLSMNVQEAAAENAAEMNALITCADTAILYDVQDFLLKRFEKSSLELRKEKMKIQHRKAMESGLLSLMGMSGYLVILLFGWRWIKAGLMTFGELVAVFQYRGGLLAGSMMFITSLMNVRSAQAGVKRINETMSLSREE